MTNANVPGPMSFFTNPSFLQTGESVTEGHPDKLCDQISDAILDAIITQDPTARVACETLVTRGLVFVTGEITTTCYVEMQDIVRETVKEAGYTDDDYGLDYKTCGVIVSINRQSEDIEAGVNLAEEDRGEVPSGSIVNIGAGDQGTMIGFACRETPTYMPMPIYLSHLLSRQLAEARRGDLTYLRPDGKSQVTVEYNKGIPERIHSITLAAQHDPYGANNNLDRDKLVRDLQDHVISAVMPKKLMSPAPAYHINGAGQFVNGGPMADAGLTGRKILVDTYGGGYKHGGGAFSGKDPTKVDRSGAYYARYIAKNIVAAGLAERCEVQLAYVIGLKEPASISIETYGTGNIDDSIMQTLVSRHFNLNPGNIIEQLDLRRTDGRLKANYRKIAAYGHFGRADVDLTWERTDKAEALRADAGLEGPPPSPPTLGA